MVKSTPTNRKASGKGAVTRRSRNAGKLAHLKDMPLDIFFEVRDKTSLCAYLPDTVTRLDCILSDATRLATHFLGL